MLYGEPGHTWPLDVEEIVLSPDGRMIAAWVHSPDPMLQFEPQVWDVQTRQPLHFSYTDSNFKWLEHTGVHKTRSGLVGVVDNKSFALRDMHTGKIVRRFDGLIMPSYPAWTFSPDGKTLWWADEHQRILWRSLE